jgi:stage III sporulation protein AA
VADERGEIAALHDGTAGHYVGRHTDILDGCTKARALMMFLRGMNPQVLAADEITEQADLRAMEEVAGCGVTLLATCHGRSPREFWLRPLYRDLLERTIFRRFVEIRVANGKRVYRVLQAHEMAAETEGERSVCS